MKDIPDKIKGDLEFVFVENMDEVVKIALTRELPGQAELDSIVGDKDFSSAFENKETASEAIKH